MRVESRRASWGDSPATDTRPAVAAVRPATTRSSVDLPQPDGPTGAANSPCGTLKLTLPSAKMAPGYVTSSASAATKGGIELKALHPLRPTK